MVISSHLLVIFRSLNIFWVILGHFEPILGPMIVRTEGHAKMQMNKFGSFKAIMVSFWGHLGSFKSFQVIQGSFEGH